MNLLASLFGRLIGEGVPSEDMKCLICWYPKACSLGTLNLSCKCWKDNKGKIFSKGKEEMKADCAPLCATVRASRAAQGSFIWAVRPSQGSFPQYAVCEGSFITGTCLKTQSKSVTCVKTAMVLQFQLKALEKSWCSFNFRKVQWISRPTF